MSLFVGIVFQASRTKVSRRKEASYVGDGMKMTIVVQVNVDTGSLVGAPTSNKFVAQSLTNITRVFRTSSNASISFKLAGQSKGTPANRLIATARSFWSLLFVFLRFI